MNLRLVRHEESSNGKATIGTLFVNGMYECVTLEDKIRAEKVFGDTGIPEGTYDVIIDYSARFKRMMPHILKVPNFEGVRIHAGNTDADTAGCILVGKVHHAGEDFIGESRLAFDALFKKMLEARDARESCRITIESAIPPAPVDGVDT